MTPLPVVADSAGIVRSGRTLSIMLTYRCPAACTSCGTLSSPSARTHLPLEAALDAIDQAADLGFAVVVFTGGETTLRWTELLLAIRHATERSLPTRIVTNAHWAHSLEQADRKLGQLIDHGLSEINYSTGDEHARFIPVERVVLATVAAARRRFRVHVMVELRAERAVTKEGLLTHPLIQSLTDEERAVLTIGESPWMPLDPDVVECYPAGVTANAANLTTRRGCPSVLGSYTLQADGRVGACCGLGLRTIPELNVTRISDDRFLAAAVEEAEADFLKLWLHHDGPEKVLAWAASHDPTIEWEDRYGHPCQACHRVYKDAKVKAVIRQHHEEMVTQVVERAWLNVAGLTDFRF